MVGCNLRSSTGIIVDWNMAHNRNAEPDAKKMAQDGLGWGTEAC